MARPSSTEGVVAELARVLVSLGWCCATAESCTGGGIAQALTTVAGSSVWFDRSYVTYSNTAKRQMLGVSEATLASHGAVSEATAQEMVAGVLCRSSADIAVAVTGIAGPGGGSVDKPVGTVVFAWGLAGKKPDIETCHFEGDRADVRAQSVTHAIDGLLARAKAHGDEKR